MRLLILCAAIFGAGLLCGCIGGNKAPANTAVSATPTVNTLAVVVDAGPLAGTTAVNHAYVSARICVSGSQTQCATVDHLLLDTGSWGLRVVASVLAAKGVSLTAETDAQGRNIAECATFGGGQTWGPVALADVTLAGELAAGLPVQVMDDTATGTPPPAACGAGGTLINDVAGFTANGVLGIGVFAHDCGPRCAAAGVPPAIYYGCAAGVCTPESVELTMQVTNPVALFAADNNGVVISMPALQNANGDTSVQGELLFGLGTQADNALPPVGLTVLGADANGDFTATYNGGTTVLPALIDSGADDYGFDDPSMAVCPSGAWVGYYCPAVAPQSVFAVNSGVGTNAGTDTVAFAVADPASFVAGASAISGLAGGGGATRFTWGMPFFYGRKIYIGLDQRSAATYVGPYYAY